MGEEFGAETPFFFFCDFGGDLAAAVAAGRRNEFAHFARFRDPAERERIPDPNAATTFEASRLNWSVLTQSPHQEWFDFYRQLLRLRSEHIVPRLSDACRLRAHYEVHGRRGLSAHWKIADNWQLTLLANLGTTPLSGLSFPGSQIIYASEQVGVEALREGTLPPWSVVWFLET
jgi:1,4-alpha-glucan branching enzyme